MRIMETSWVASGGGGQPSHPARLFLCSPGGGGKEVGGGYGWEGTGSRMCLLCAFRTGAVEEYNMAEDLLRISTKWAQGAHVGAWSPSKFFGAGSDPAVCWMRYGT